MDHCVCVGGHLGSYLVVMLCQTVALGSGFPAPFVTVYYSITSWLISQYKFVIVSVLSLPGEGGSAQ